MDTNNSVHDRVNRAFNVILGEDSPRTEMTTNEITMVLAMTKASGLDVLTDGERQIIDGLIEIIERRAAVEMTKGE